MNAQTFHFPKGRHLEEVVGNEPTTDARICVQHFDKKCSKIRRIRVKNRELREAS